MRFPSFNIELYLKIVCPDTFFRNCSKISQTKGGGGVSLVVMQSKKTNKV